MPFPGYSGESFCARMAGPMETYERHMERISVGRAIVVALAIRQAAGGITLREICIAINSEFGTQLRPNELPRRAEIVRNRIERKPASELLKRIGTENETQS